MSPLLAPSVIGVTISVKKPDPRGKAPWWPVRDLKPNIRIVKEPPRWMGR